MGPACKKLDLPVVFPYRLDPMKIIVPPESYRAITGKYPHLAEQFEPYQHISERDQSVLDRRQPPAPSK